MSKILFVDCETSGVSAKQNALLQLSGVISVGGQKRESFNFFLKPFEKDILVEESMAICGITKAQIATDQKFEDPRAVYAKFTKILDRTVDRFDRSDKMYLVGYRSDFDSGFIREFFLKNGNPYYGAYFFFPPIDLAVIAAFKLMLGGGREKLENFKLVSVAKAFGVEVDTSKAHDAMYDIEITRQLFYKLVGRPPAS